MEALPLIDDFSFYVQVGNSERDFSLQVSLLIGTQVVSPLCGRIDLQHWCMSLYIFLTSLSQSISQRAVCGVMDYVAGSLPAMFPLEG